MMIKGFVTGRSDRGGQEGGKNQYIVQIEKSSSPHTSCRLRSPHPVLPDFRQEEFRMPNSDRTEAAISSQKLKGEATFRVQILQLHGARTRFIQHNRHCTKSRERRVSRTSLLKNRFFKSVVSLSVVQQSANAILGRSASSILSAEQQRAYDTHRQSNSCHLTSLSLVSSVRGCHGRMFKYCRSHSHIGQVNPLCGNIPPK